MDIAASDIVVAGEEVARARILFAVYEDLVTFDKTRRTERIYISEKQLSRDHKMKYAVLMAFGIGLSFGLSRLRLREMPPDEKDAFLTEAKQHSENWFKKNFEGLSTLLEFSDVLEDLRMSRYSGPTPRGTTPPTLSREDYQRLENAVSDQIDFASFEQNVYVRFPGELETLQANMPGVVKAIQDLLGELVKSGTFKPTP